MVIDLEQKRKAYAIKKQIESVQAEIAEFKELAKTIKNTLNVLTKYEKYSKIRRIMGDMLETYHELLQVIEKKNSLIVTLEIRKTDE